MKNDDGKRIGEMMLAAVQDGTVAVPHLLIKHYHKLKLSDMEAMLLVHLLAFKEKDNKDFPTPEEIESRMSSAPGDVIKTLQRLLNEGFIHIDEETDLLSGVHYERYNLTPVLRKLVSVWMEEIDRQTAPDPGAGESGGKDLFSIFENEFARPLTPMECETVAGWIDGDQYPQELILAALKEAVFAGKVHFRYIDRILLDWSRNRVFTVEQAKEYTQKFRGVR